MSDRQIRILQELQLGPVSQFSLASRLNAPTDSVRRDVAALRKAGHAITDARHSGGVYRLTAA